MKVKSDMSIIKYSVNESLENIRKYVKMVETILRKEIDKVRIALRNNISVPSREECTNSFIEGNTYCGKGLRIL